MAGGQSRPLFQESQHTEATTARPATRHHCLLLCPVPRLGVQWSATRGLGGLPPFPRDLGGSRMRLQGLTCTMRK